MSLSVEDKIELQELAGRYGDYVDDRDWDKLDEIFTEDAVFEFSILDTTLNGVEEIKNFLSGLGDQHPQGHLMMNIYSDKTDHGAQMRFRAIFPIANRSATDGSAVFFHASYYDDLVKTNKGWRVKNRVVIAGARSAN